MPSDPSQAGEIGPRILARHEVGHERLVAVGAGDEAAVSAGYQAQMRVEVSGLFQQAPSSRLRTYWPGSDTLPLP